MSHYAKVVSGVVTQVIVADAAFMETFQDSSPGTWLQTSYNTRGGVHLDPVTQQPDDGIALRGNYAGIGYIYDPTNDVFYEPKPYPSWTISAPAWLWQPPSPLPSSGGPYQWDETTQTWVAVGS